MAKIQHSIHSRSVGVAAPTVPTASVPSIPGPHISFGGYAAGEHGKQIRYASPSHVSFFDDFLGDVIPDQINLVEGTDSATSAGAILAGGIGGVLRLTTGDAGTGYAADAEQLTMALQWQASNGDLCFETRIKPSAITTCQIFVGFTDDASTLEAPVESAGSVDTITTNATDAVGFMYDTRQSSDVWTLVGVANDVDATHQVLTSSTAGYVPVADQYQTLRVEVSPAGVATFFINGRQVGTPMTGAVTAATDLTPVITVSKTSVTASMTLDIDYLHVSMRRGADGTAV